MREIGAWNCCEPIDDIAPRCGNRGSCPPKPPPRKTLRVSRSAHRSHTDYDDENTTPGPPKCYPSARSGLLPICPAVRGLGPLLPTSLPRSWEPPAKLALICRLTMSYKALTASLTASNWN